MNSHQIQSYQPGSISPTHWCKAQMHRCTGFVAKYAIQFHQKKLSPTITIFTTRSFAQPLHPMLYSRGGQPFWTLPRPALHRGTQRPNIREAELYQMPFCGAFLKTNVGGIKQVMHFKNEMQYGKWMHKRYVATGL